MTHSLPFKLASAFVLATFVIAEAASVGSSAYALIQDEGSNLTRRSTLNFTGAGVTCSDGSGKTTCNISGGGGGGSFYQTIQQAGVSLPQEAILNFAANAACVDNPGVSTDCTPSGGGGGGGVAVGSGTFAARPGAGTNTGDLWLTTNSPMSFRWTGAAWTSFGPVRAFTAFTGAGYTWINQGTATGAVNRGYWRFDYPTSAAAEDEHVFVRTASATDSIIVCFALDPAFQNSQHFGLVLGDSGTGRLTTMAVYNDNGVAIFDRANPSTFSGVVNIITSLAGNRGNMLWMRIDITAATHTFFLSTDGEHFIQTFQRAAGAWLATTDQIGMSGNGQNSSFAFGANVYEVQ
jgi:hypothetical protein